MAMKGWKAFRLGHDGKLRFVFHPHSGQQHRPA